MKITMILLISGLGANLAFADELSDGVALCREMEALLKSPPTEACKALYQENDMRNIKVETLSFALESIPIRIEQEQRVWGSTSSCPINSEEIDTLITKVEDQPAMRKRDKVKATVKNFFKKCTGRA